jgi:hypothetical protein
MGMDGVEIVMKVEGITIADEEAEEVRTPGMLIDLVAQKLGPASRQYCISQRSFYILRNAVVRLTPYNRNQLTPNTSTHSLVAPENEKTFWGDLQAEVEAKSWPPLGLHTNIERGRNATLLLIWFCSTRFFLQKSDRSFSIAAGIVTFLASALLFVKASRLYQNYIPARIKTLRDIVPFVETSPKIAWSREDIPLRVAQIVEEVLSPPPGAYRETADFVKDLGLS